MAISGDTAARPASASTLHHVDPHPILGEIAVFLAEQGIPDWEFGLVAIGDPNLVRQLRAGRDLRRSTASRVRAFMARFIAECC